MPKKRQEKELPIHLEYLPPLPDFDTDPDGNLDAYFYRIGALGSGSDYVPASDNPARALALFKKICKFDHEPTLGELEALAADREWKPLSDVMQAEIELRNKRHDSQMDNKRLRFEQTKNPLFAWDAFSICRKKNKPIPKWVFDYLASVTKKIMNSNAQPKDLPDILGFKDTKKLNGGAQAFKQYLTMMLHTEAVANVVNILRNQPEKTIDAACEEAFELMKKRWLPKSDNEKRSRYSVASIKGWYTAYQKQSMTKGGET